MNRDDQSTTVESPPQPPDGRVDEKRVLLIDGLVSLLVVVAAVLVLFPEPVTSLLGAVLAFVAVFLLLVDLVRD